MAKLTKRAVDALKPREKAFIAYDDELKGLGVRVNPSGVKTWIAEFRPYGGGSKVRQTRLALGRTNILSADEARDAARDVLQEARKGGNPAKRRADSRAMPLFRDFLDTYLAEEAEQKLKPRTVANYRIYLRKHAAAELGATKLDAITQADVLKLHRSIGRTNPITANRVVETLSSLFRFAIQSGALPRSHDNPAAGIEAFREQGRERFLSSAELARLGDALRLAETDGLPWTLDETAKVKHRPKDAEQRGVVVAKHVTDAVRLLLFTGARLREVLHLEWNHWDRERGLLLLPDSKTGKRAIVLNAAALAVLSELEAVRVGRFVIAGATAGTRDEKPRADIKRSWERIRAHAGLEDVRLHDLRHTHASFGAGGGLGLPIIGKLLGHKSAATTSRYAHLDSDPLRRASTAIGESLRSALDGKSARVIPMQRALREA